MTNFETCFFEGLSFFFGEPYYASVAIMGAYFYYICDGKIVDRTNEV